MVLTTIDLPISKSIANRLLILQAMHGDPLLEVSCAMPDDVQVMHTALTGTDSHVFVDNCGTAARFLTAFFATQEGREVVIDGSDRMRQRPIAPLVEALRGQGADISYLAQEGFLPLRIVGKPLRYPTSPIEIDTAISTQFASALLLVGMPVQESQSSPYIALTRALVAKYQLSTINYPLESDWSSAAFWYEYVALHGGELMLKGLQPNSLQPDAVVASLFRPLGVETTFTEEGCMLCKDIRYPLSLVNQQLSTIDFSSSPDLYPAYAVACRRLGLTCQATGLDRLPYKESNRLLSVRQLLQTTDGQVVTTYHDHRIAMAAMAADMPVDDEACVSKSYPHFVEQLNHLHRL